MADRFEPAYTQNFTTVATVHGALSAERLERALRSLERRHPLLRARVDRGGGEPSFVVGEAKEVPLLLAQASEQELLELVARTLEPCAWGDAGPHAELTWVQHGDERSSLLLRQHHLVSDGGSGIIAMRDLLSLIDDPALERVEPVPSPGQDAFFPPSFSQLRRTVLEQINAGAPRAREALRISCWDHPSPAVRRTSCLRLRLTELESSAIAVRARREVATVHGTLMAAFALAIAQETGRAGLQRLTHPVDLRRYLRELEPTCPSIPDAMGYYVSSLTTEHEVHGHEALGVLAREITQAVRAAKSAREPLWTAPIRGPLLVERTRDLDVNAFRELSELKIFRNTFGISNLGALERLGAASKVGALEVEDFFFAGASSVMNQVGGSAVSFAGRLSLVLNCLEPMVSRELLAALTARIEEMLRAYAQSHGLLHSAS
jgi:hypothetical protein